MAFTSELELRIAVLKEQMDFIHTANQKYWRSEEGRQSREARAEYEKRGKQLEEIRLELLDLGKMPPLNPTAAN